MIEYKTGNLFKTDCQTLVNTVNCKAVMGKGIALYFKKRYPNMFNEYKLACNKGILKGGGDLFVYDYIDLYKPKKILCFATKEHWMYPSKLEWIERGLKNFVNNYKKLGITSIAFPKLGCTNGKLNWDDVKSLMEKYLNDLPIKIEIYI